MGFSVEVPVFIDTNLDTHIAMAVSPDITVGDLKRELGYEHSNCFPDIGKIRIHGLKVKKKSYFYYLPDSMPIKNVFQGLKRAWFLRMNATPVIRSGKCCPSEGLVAEQRDSTCYDSDVTDSQKPDDSTNCTSMKDTNDKARRTKRKQFTSLEYTLEEILSPVNVVKKKRKTKKSCFSEEGLDGRKEVFLDAIVEDQCGTSHPTFKAPSPNTSEIVSVQGILSRYFPEFDEVKSYEGPSVDKTIDHHEANQTDENENLKTESAKAPPKVPSSPMPTNPNPKTSRTRLGQSKVGITPPPQMPSTPANNTSAIASKGKLERSKVRKHLPKKQSPKTSTKRPGRSEVGRRLVQAANDLGIPTSKKKPAIYLCESNSVKLSSTLVRKLVFEVSDSDN